MAKPNTIIQAYLYQHIPLSEAMQVRVIEVTKDLVKENRYAR